MTFDPNVVAAKVASDSLKTAVAAVGTLFGDVKKTVSVGLQRGFDSYRKKSIARYGTVRTLMHRDKPIPLPELYVAASFRHAGEELTDHDVIGQLAAPSKIVIKGTAGGGKSVFMRFMNLVLCNIRQDILPIFFELKSLNTDNPTTLTDALISHVHDVIADVDAVRFKALMREGRIVLLLDGFDEIDPDRRETYAKEISGMGRIYPGLTIVMSSRPDDIAVSLENFNVYNVLPFTKDQAIELITRLPYDEIPKSKFMEAVNKELYEKHKAFLSSPLLITMMLMTYHQFAEIPTKIHIFYQQAFETLFSWHDASKDVFKRKTYTDLPIDEFQRVFSYFCVSSYKDQRFQFDTPTLRERIAEALKAEGIASEPDLFIRDLLESTCLLQKDGLEIVFVHRSFQEYFTGLYISRLDVKGIRVAIERVLKRAWADSVIQMAYEMNPAMVETGWCLPTIKTLHKRISGYDPSSKPLEFLKLFFNHIDWGVDRLTLYYNVNSVWGRRLLALAKIYKPVTREFDKSGLNENYKKYVERLRTDPGFAALHAPAIATPKPRDLVPGHLPSEVHFRLGKMLPEMKDWIPLATWAPNWAAAIKAMRTQIADRIESRSSSFSKMFAKA